MALLLLAMFVPALATAAFFVRAYSMQGHSEKCFAPPFLPVKLQIVYHGESILKGSNCANYEGTATYTFRNEQSFPVTLAFPPLCCYTYSRSKPVTFAIPPFYKNTSTTTWQETPFPDEERPLPDFAREQRDVVIPAGQSIDFTAPFNMLCTDGPPAGNQAFVFGTPRSPCEHPVLGTIYATSVKYTEMPEDLTSTDIDRK